MLYPGMKASDCCLSMEEKSLSGIVISACVDFNSKWWWFTTEISS